MYVRRDAQRRIPLSIPQNYSGNAFSDDIQNENDIESEGNDHDLISTEVDNQVSPAEPNDKGRGNFLPINIGNEELIIIGIILLLFQNGSGNDMIPILLALLFLGGDGKH